MVEVLLIIINNILCVYKGFKVGSTNSKAIILTFSFVCSSATSENPAFSEYNRKAHVKHMDNNNLSNWHANS